MTESQEDQSSPASDVSGARPVLRLRHLVAFCYAVAIFMIVGGLVLRLTVRDGAIVGATLFYATPLAILNVLTLLCLLRDLFHKRLRRVLCWAILQAVLLPWWYQHDWRSGTSAKIVHQHDSEAIDVLFWNLARRADLMEEMAYVRQADADIVGFVEVGGHPDDQREFFRQMLPQYEVSVLGKQMFLLSKGPSGQTRVGKLARGSASRNLTVRLKDRQCEVFLVDIDANVRRPRGPALQMLADLANDYADRPVLILGDFNTPPDSVCFDSLRERHRMVFEEAGTGYAPTWPLPWPVLHLDQIWVNDGFDAVACRHGMTDQSDHRPVHATVRWAGSR